MTTDTRAPDVLVGGRTPSGGLSRRLLLKRLGVGAATLVVAGTGAASYRVYDNGVLGSGEGSPYDPWTTWRDDPSPLGAVGAAVLAANPHDTQPWSFLVLPDQVDVFTDPRRRMPAVDPFDREHHVGLGCAVENLVLGLRARGYEGAVTWLPSPQDPTHVAAVRLTATAGISSAQHEAIGSRHSNRGPYTDVPVSAEVIDALTASATDLAGVRVQWFTSIADRAALTAVMLDATQAFIDDAGQSRESFSWFRNNRDDIDTHRDGPTLDAQGLSPLTLTLAKLLPASSRTAGDAFWLGQTRDVHTATAAAYGVVTVSDAKEVTSRLVGGRALQRIHLEATSRGVALQHMNQITERIDREARLGAPPTFGPRLQALLTDGQPLVTFRIGYPVRTALLSPRRALSAVLR